MRRARRRDAAEKDAEGQIEGHAPGLRWDAFRTVLLNPRFMVAMVCFAIPSKALLTGGLFLLMPLAVVGSGGSASDSARVIMAYGIAILLLAPIMSPLADRWRKFHLWVAVGCCIAAIGLVLPHTWDTLGQGGLIVLMAATLLFGVGQTLSIPAQISYLMQVSEKRASETSAGAVLGTFRFIERLGSLFRPAGCQRLAACVNAGGGAHADGHCGRAADGLRTELVPGIRR